MRISVAMVRTSILLAFAITLSASRTAAQSIDTLTLRAHTRFLASDLLEGRGAGTRGEHLAAEYIVSQLVQLGLRPVGDDFRQPVPLRRVAIDSATHLVLRRGSDSLVFRHGRDFVLSSGGATAFHDFAGDALFIGNAEHAARMQAMDGALRGKVVVVTGTLGAEASVLVPAWRAAGVEGVILLVPEDEQYALIARSRGPYRYFVEADLQDPIWQSELPTLIAGRGLSSALLTGARLSQQALEGQLVAPAALGRHVRAKLKTQVEPVASANVAGMIVGADAALRAEHVMYTAHYDHLGVSHPDARGDSIYNGFSDNAAGVAMLFTIAEVMMAAPPARSVVFLFPTAEERGLLGSSYYALRPLLPLGQLAALINLDAGAPPAPPVSWRIAGDSTILGSLARSIAERRQWQLQFSAATPNSDYWPFAVRGVPTAFIVPGGEWEHTSAEQRDALRRRWDRYHTAADEWAPDFPFHGLLRYAEFALELGRAAAEMPRRSTP
jgi:hypothetical protein